LSKERQHSLLLRCKSEFRHGCSGRMCCPVSVYGRWRVVGPGFVGRVLQGKEIE
jgi:hypothetical protein